MAVPGAEGPRLAVFREQAKKEFWVLLDEVKGDKALAFDDSLIGALQAAGVADPATLREKGVGHLYRVTEEALETEARTVVYVVRPTLRTMKIIAKHVRHRERHPPPWGPPAVVALLVPRCPRVCERLLEEEGVRGSVTLRPFALDFVVQDQDLLSMEAPHSLRAWAVEGDGSAWGDVARAIARVEAQWGVVPDIRGKGRAAQRVMQILRRLRQEQSPTATPDRAPQIHQLYLIDREIDLVTPFLMQHTYEGLIAELFGIRSGILEPPFPVRKEEGAKKATAPRKPKVELSSRDRVFAEVRDLNFSEVGARLNAKALYLEGALEERRGLKDILQIRDFMRRLPELQLDKENLAVHIEIAQQLKSRTAAPAFRRRVAVEQNMLDGEDERGCLDYVEECIARQEAPRQVLRLLALFSAVNGGLKPKTLEFFRREIMQTYGFEAMLLLDNLERAGVLRRSEGRSTFPTLKKGLRLLVPDGNGAEPKDIAYTYSGYAPLSVRLLEAGLRGGGWRAGDPHLALLPGPYVEERLTDIAPAAGPPSVVLVAFLGGVTSAELSALRCVADQLRASPTGPQHVLVLTTHIITGASLLDGLFEHLGAIE